jgi:hypothetical protein
MALGRANAVHEMIAVNVVVLWSAVAATSVVILRRRRAGERRPSEVAGPAERSRVEQLR